MKRVLFLLTFLLVASTLHAGPLDPWYLAYQVHKGTLIQYLGPFATKAHCLAARSRMPIGAKYLGCSQ